MTFESSGSASMGPAGEADPPATHTLRFDKSGLGGLVGLHVVNIIFMVLTLFVYRFWALTRVRRALWPRMSLDGTPLEYTGTGLEIFIGFLKVFILILLPYGIFSNWVNLNIVSPELGFSPLFLFLSVLSGLGLLYLYAAARFLAYRYRVNRTQWRGIRGSVGGAAYVYGLRTLGYYFLLAITLGAVKPWTDVRLLQYRMENTKFGGKPFGFTASTNGLWPHYLVFLFFYLLFLGCILLPYAHFFSLMVWPSISGSPGPHVMDHAAVQSFGMVTSIAGGLAFIAGACAALAYLNYLVIYWRNVVGKMSFGMARFRFRPTRWGVFWLYVGNWLIIVFSLGLLMPIAWLRKGAFLARHLQIVGTIETDDLIQAEFDTNATGEGLLGDFDIA